MKTHQDPITVPPTASGPAGRFWRCTPFKDPKAVIAEWVLEAPGAHIAWHSYGLSLVTLADIGDGEEIINHLEGATHEFWLYALNPNFAREPAIDGRTSPYTLSLAPLNFAAQLVCAGDDVAKGLIEAALSECVHGRLSPDTDYRSLWAQRFGDNMLRR
jgi:hypothetical protein